jgi:DNA-binding beta-propeller fold protein YncE
MNLDGSSQLTVNRTTALLVALAAVTAMLLVAASTAWGMGTLSQAKGSGGCISAKASYNGTYRGDQGKYRGAKCKRGRMVGGWGSVISPDGRNIYAISYAGDSIAAFSRNPATGALRQLAGKAGCLAEKPGKNGCGKGRALDGPLDLALSPDGRFVLVAAEDSSAISIFKRNPTTGALTQPAGRGGCLGGGGESGCASADLDGVTMVAVSPDGKNVYASTEAKVLLTFDLDPASGALTQKPGEAGCASQGGLSGCAPARALGSPLDLLVSADGKNVYATGLELGPKLGESMGVVSIFTRDQATGAVKQLEGAAGCFASKPTAGMCAELQSAGATQELVLSPDGRQAYLASSEPGALTILDRDPATGALSPKVDGGCIAGFLRDGSTFPGCQSLGDFGGGGIAAGIASVALSPDGGNVYVGNAGTKRVIVFDRDATTGLLTRKPGRAGCIGQIQGKRRCAVANMSRVNDVLVDPDGKNVYAVGAYPATVVTLVRSAR